MTQEVNEIEQIVAFTALLVQNAGGEVRIPIAEVEKGLPAGHGVHIQWEGEEGAGELVFRIQERE